MITLITRYTSSRLHLIVLQWLISFLNGSEMLVSQQFFQFGKLSHGKILGLIDLVAEVYWAYIIFFYQRTVSAIKFRKRLTEFIIKIALP